MTAAAGAQPRNVRPIDVVEVVADFFPDGEDPRKNLKEKFLRLLVSRKFWLIVVGLLLSLGAIDASEDTMLQPAEAIVTLTAFVAMAFGIAIEDGLSNQGKDKK